MEKFTFINQRARPLKQALSECVSGLSGQAIARALSNKDIKVNGKRVKENVALAVFDEVTIFYNAINFYDVVYSDDNVLIVNKLRPIETTDNAHSVVLQSDGARNLQETKCEKGMTEDKENVRISFYGRDDTLQNLESDGNHGQAQNSKGVQGNRSQIAPYSFKQTLESEVRKTYKNARAVHRLDINTLGLVCFALNDASERELIHAFRCGNVEKKYIAQVSSENVKPHEEFCDLLIKDSENSRVRIKPYDSSACKGQNSGQLARLDYDLLSRSGDTATILITLHTGKTHQIRAQLAYHKIYILGDGKYGDKALNRKYKKSTQQLKSVYLKFRNLNSLDYLCCKQFSLL